VGPEPVLLPRPRSLEQAPGGRRVPDRPAQERLDPALHPQGYRLEVDDGGVRIVGADDAGLRHGRATLAQLRHSTATPGTPGTPGTRGTPGTPGTPGTGTLPACRIDDWPDFAVRGVMLDVSRDRVPTLDTLYALVDRMAAWKLNQLQLYMEHTFAYAGHEEVWRHADPYTADDLHALEAYGRARGSSSWPTRTRSAISSAGSATTATDRSPSPPTASIGSSGSTGRR